MTLITVVKNSNHPDVPNGTEVKVRNMYKGGFEVEVTCNFAKASSLYVREKETRIIWLSKKQLHTIT